MPHDQPSIQAQNKIEQALKSDAMELTIRLLFICFLSVKNKGGTYDA